MELETAKAYFPEKFLRRKAEASTREMTPEGVNGFYTDGAMAPVSHKPGSSFRC